MKDNKMENLFIESNEYKVRERTLGVLILVELELVVRHKQKHT